MPNGPRSVEQLAKELANVLKFNPQLTDQERYLAVLNRMEMVQRREPVIPIADYQPAFEALGVTANLPKTVN